jgi:hypothetical protein
VVRGQSAEQMVLQHKMSEQSDNENIPTIEGGLAKHSDSAAKETTIGGLRPAAPRGIGLRCGPGR